MENIIIYCPNCGMKHRIKFLDNERFDVEFKCQCGEVIKVEGEDTNEITIQEAIDEIKEATNDEVKYGEMQHSPEEVTKRIEAFNLAIKALEQYETMLRNSTWY